MKKPTLKVVVASFLLMGFSAFSFAEVVVVVNSASGITSMSKKDASRIFLRKTKKVSGKKLIAVDQKEGSASRDTFYSKVANKSAAKLKAYWSSRIFSGKGKPPKSLEGDDSIVKWVSGNADAVGYLDKSKVDGSVVVVYTVK